MRTLLRGVAIYLLVALPNVQLAAAGCIMTGTFGESAIEHDAGPHGGHSAGAAATTDVRESGDSESHDTERCDLMTACVTAAPAALVGSVDSGPFAYEPSAALAAAAYTSPSVAFEPPPPRHPLI